MSLLIVLFVGAVLVLAIVLAFVMASTKNKKSLDLGPVQFVEPLQLTELHPTFSIRINGKKHFVPKRFLGKVQNQSFLLSTIIVKGSIEGTSSRYAKNQLMIEFPIPHEFQKETASRFLKNLPDFLRKSSKIIDRKKSSLPSGQFENSKSVIIDFVDESIAPEILKERLEDFVKHIQNYQNLVNE